MQVVDSLPGPVASWTLAEVTVTGTLKDRRGRPLTETADIWMRNINEVVRDLVSNSEFGGCTSWEPYQEVELNENGTETGERFIEDMPSADWWWEIQVRELANREGQPLTSGISIACPRRLASHLLSSRQTRRS